MKLPIISALHEGDGAAASSVAGDARAFTRLDACALFAVVGLLAVLTYPALGGTRTRSDRVVCANHLRQIGKAFLEWGQEHNDSVPWERTIADGGTYNHPLAMNAWLHFSWISNELQSARVLACPSDRSSRPADDFTGSPATGDLNPNFANRATSYFLSHWSSVTPAVILAGDYNILRDGYASCSRFRSVAFTTGTGLRNVGWTSDLHDQNGNLLFFDGRVEQTDNAGFFSLAKQMLSDSDNSNLHWLLPRQ